MKTNRNIISKLVVLLLLFSAVANLSYGQEDSAKRYALLVAVTKYNHAQMNQPQLEFPEEDAKAVGKFLKDHGYEVDYLLGKEATQKAIETRLSELSTKGNSDGVCLVGFWGHGVEFSDSKESMFCPFDAGIRFAVDSQGKKLFDKTGKKRLVEPDPKSLVGMGSVLENLQLCPAGNKLLLADCCRNSPNQARGRAFGSEIKITDLPGNTAAIFACQADQIAYESKNWGHGALTKALLDLLPQKVASKDTSVTGLLSPLKKNVNRLVVDSSNGRDKQTIQPILNGIPDLKLIAKVKKWGHPFGDDAERTTKLVNEINGVTKNFSADLHRIYLLGKLKGPRHVGSPIETSRSTKDLARQMYFFMNTIDRVNDKEYFDRCLKEWQKLMGEIPVESRGEHAELIGRLRSKSPRELIEKIDTVYSILLNPGHFNQFLSSTTKKERQALLKQNKVFHMPGETYADSAIIASIRGDYEMANRFLKEARYSHAAYAVIAPIIDSNLDEAKKLASSLQNSKQNSTGWLILINTLLNQNEVSKARQLLATNPVDHTKGGILCVFSPMFWFPVAEGSNRPLNSWAFVAGRLNDEKMFKQILNESKLLEYEVDVNILRLHFLWGLVVDYRLK